MYPWFARTYGLAALICAVGTPAALVGCDETTQHTLTLDEADDSLDFRDDGCGAGLKKGKVEQTCKFKPKYRHSDADPFADYTIVGTCDGSDTIDCKYTFKGCEWEATSESSCKKEEPACKLPAAPTIEYFHSYSLPTGHTVCDPPESDHNRAVTCRWLGLNKKVDGKYAFDLMKEKCLAKTTDSTKSKVECCVPKATTSGTTGGASTSGGSSGCEDTGESTATSGEATGAMTGWTDTSAGATTGWTSTTGETSLDTLTSPGTLTSPIPNPDEPCSADSVADCAIAL